eukprot:g2088.t1
MILLPSRKISLVGPRDGKSVSNRSSDVAPSSANVEAGDWFPTLAFFSGFLSAAALLALLVCVVQCDQTDGWVVGREEYRGYLVSAYRSEASGYDPTRPEWTWRHLRPWYSYDISCFLAREAGLPRPVQYLLAGLCTGCLLVVVLLDEAHCVPPRKDEEKNDWAAADLLERGAEQEEPLVLRGEQAATPTPVEEMKMNQEDRRDPRTTSALEPISGESCLRRTFSPRSIPWWFRLISGVISAAGLFGTIHFDAKVGALHPVMFGLCFASYFVLLVATAVMSARAAFPTEADERNARAAHGAESRRMPHAQQGEKELLEDEPEAEERQAEPVPHPLMISESTPSHGLVLQKLYVFALLSTAVLITALLSLWVALQCVSGHEFMSRLHERHRIEREEWTEFKKQHPQGGEAFRVEKLAASELNSVYEWGAAALWALSIVLVSGRMLVFRRWRSA